MASAEQKSMRFLSPNRCRLL